MEIIPKPWSVTEKILFRFFCCLFLIYLFPFPLNIFESILPVDADNPPKFIKWYYTLFGYYDNFLHAFVPWVGKHILHLAKPIVIFTNGSGDTTYDYVALFTFFSLSIIGTLAWTIMDKKRPSYAVAYFWLRAIIRYSLALYMLGYGLYKVFHLQMLSPYLTQLVQPFGDKSPMGLAWSFVGFSKGFSAFTGWGEVIGGILLFFRKTTTLGALILVAVLSNVVAINFFYDVPVKLFSSMLLLMTFFLLAPDAGRLWNVLYTNKATAPRYSTIPVKKRGVRVAGVIFKLLIIVMSIYSTISVVQKGQKQYGDHRTIPHYYGIYNVQYWIRNRDTLPPLDTDTVRWKRIIIQFPGYATVYLMNDSAKSYAFNLDSTFRNVTLYPSVDTSHKYNFVIDADSSSLRMSGVLMKDSVRIVFHKHNLNSFRLLNRGFHWINEYPYNK